MHNFKDLEVWQKSIVLCKQIYQLGEQIPKDQKYSLTGQIQRCAVSIPSNIAEGAGRGTKKSFTHFIQIALGSSFELETQLILAQKLFTEINTEQQILRLNEIQRMLVGMKKWLQK
jgi:four helix bundle protein